MKDPIGSFTILCRILKNPVGSCGDIFIIVNIFCTLHDLKENPIKF